jgi:hypothetical protein
MGMKDTSLSYVNTYCDTLMSEDEEEEEGMNGERIKNVLRMKPQVMLWKALILKHGTLVKKMIPDPWRLS